MITQAAVDALQVRFPKKSNARYRKIVAERVKPLVKAQLANNPRTQDWNELDLAAKTASVAREFAREAVSGPTPAENINLNDFI